MEKLGMSELTKTIKLKELSEIRFVKPAGRDTRPFNWDAEFTHSRLLSDREPGGLVQKIGVFLSGR